MWSINGSVDRLDHSINALFRAINRPLRQRTQRWSACARTGEAAAAASKQGTNNNPAKPPTFVNPGILEWAWIEVFSFLFFSF
jgi:hypothetical protein